METFKFLITSSFYPPYHVGGACVHTKYLAEELANRGHEVHVMHSLDAYQIKRGKKALAKDEASYNHLFIHAMKSPIEILDPLMVYSSGNSFYTQKIFSEIIKKIQPDIVHHQNISLLGYNILKKRDNYICLYTAHDYWLICQRNNLLKTTGKVCYTKSCYLCALKSRRLPQLWRDSIGFKTAIKDIDLLISPSNYVRNRLRQEISVRSITLPNFVPSPPVNIHSIGYSNYFLFVGRLEQDKGIIELLGLFKKLGKNLNAKLIIVGTGSLKYYVQDFIEKNSLSDFILSFGFVDNKILYMLYANALAVIIPSIWPENAPLVALEAISVGTPVIASNNGGLPEIIKKVDKKLIFDNIEMLEYILLNFSKKDFPSEKIKRSYEQNFSPHAYINRYIEAIYNI